MGLLGFGKSNDGRKQDSPIKNTNWHNEGESLVKLEKYEEAISCYDKIIRLDPQDLKAWSNKGFALINLEEYEEAISCYNQVIRFNSKDYNAWFNRGNSLANLRKYEEAISCYDRVIKINPDEVSGMETQRHGVKKIRWR